MPSIHYTEECVSKISENLSSQIQEQVWPGHEDKII